MHAAGKHCVGPCSHGDQFAYRTLVYRSLESSLRSHDTSGGGREKPERHERLKVCEDGQPDPYRTRTGPVPDPYRTRTGPVPDPYRTRTGPVPDPYRTRTGPVPDPYRTRTGPGPVPDPYRTRTARDPVGSAVCEHGPSQSLAWLIYSTLAQGDIKSMLDCWLFSI